jgi:hypothetical protein
VRYPEHACKYGFVALPTGSSVQHEGRDRRHDGGRQHVMCLRVRVGRPGTEPLSRAAAKIGLDPVPVIDNPELDETADPDPER